MSSVPGQNQFGGGSVAAIPRLAQASTMTVHQQIVHIMVHTHPQNLPKRRPVVPLKRMLQDHSNAHEDEEADGADFGSPLKAPYPEIVYHRRHAEHAQ